MYVAGGLGAHSRVGSLLEQFVPAGAAGRIAEAVKRVFDKHGNRRDRRRARLRFVVEDLSFEEFERLYRAELGEPVGRPLQAPQRESSQSAAGQVLPQKQAGLFAIEIAPPLGIVNAGQLRQLAAIAGRCGEGRVRATSWQTMALRNVPAESIETVTAELTQAGLWHERPPILRHMATCAGASTCRLGIGLSRGLANAVQRALLNSGLDLAGAAGQLTLHISGCPNSCGHHPIASIDLFGAARRVKGRLTPYYVVQFGGHVEEGHTRLATGDYAISARNVPAFLVDFLRAVERSRHNPDFAAFLAGEGSATALALSAIHGSVPEFQHAKSFTLIGARPRHSEPADSSPRRSGPPAHCWSLAANKRIPTGRHSSCSTVCLFNRA